MKKIALFLVGIFMVCSLAACGSQDEPSVSEPDSAPETITTESQEPDGSEELAESNVPETDSNVEAETESESEGQTGRILVAYFSRSGNTEIVAQAIQEHTGGDLFEIVPEEPYPEDYDETVERFRRERDEDARPAIASSVEDMDAYDVIFVGYPNWGSDMPHVVRTFLEQYDFAGKTVIPFCTNGGGGFGNSVNTLESLCPDSEIMDGYQVSGSSAANRLDEVTEWLDRLDFEN